MNADTGRPTFLLVHGAWHGAWCWDPVRAALDADGWRSDAVDLPSANPPVGRHHGACPAGVLDDANAIRDSLRRIDGPVVVIAHSYGGVPTTEAIADAANVVGAVYLAAFQLDVGESLLTFLGTPAPDDDTGHTPPYEDARRILFDDVPEAVADRAVARLRPQSVRTFTDRVTAAGWRTVPSAYIVCDRDQSLEPSRQRELATRADSVHRLPSSHSPFLSMPRQLATLLGRIATSTLPTPRQ
ncbi:alpha/beta fold hydrolase [Streptomyces sp. UNOB3_S3]|uniref:alpha/beta fold hydrolase n=1 Tax=Streptomyces sp. UNOB3_S3 TaxID=2871682 RepID=UPI001E3AC350|nr:alpha/beta fold hydrolase [Streptomyces sp. UNOB3_S3]MCC3773736.1 alpha/beta fold hydrolase [Streptomyces sp. UNOB3_S3]